MQLKLFKPCNVCGDTKSITEFHKDKRLKDGRDNVCKSCINERDRNWRSAHKETVKQYNRNTHAKNREKQNAQMLEYGRAHRDSVNERMRRWWKENSERVCAKRRLNHQLHNEEINKKKRNRYAARPGINRIPWQRRRALKKNSGGTFTASEWKELCDRYGNRCLSCGEVKPLTADHVVPLVKGGVNDISNLQPLCKSCNSRKGTKTIDYR